jgi:putative DNA primase/helicase
VSTATPIKTIVQRLNAKKVGEHQWQAKCPCHDDEKASLSVSIGDNGTPVLYCHAGCNNNEIIAKLGFKWSDFYASQNGTSRPAESKPKRAPKVYATPEEAAQSFARWKQGTVETLYKWSDDWRRVRIQVGNDKTFAEITRNGDGWILKGPQKPHPLYRIRQVPADDVVYITEGEKSTDAGWSIDLPCVTSGGTSSASAADWSPLAGRRVCILPDHDEPGEKYAHAVADKLLKLTPPAEIRIVRLPDLDDGEDLYEFVHEHRDSHIADDIRAEIEGLFQQAKPERPPQGYNRTDLGNAERLVHEHGESLRYTDATGWLVWTGTHWERDTADAVEKFAKDTVRGMYLEAARTEDRENRRRLAEWALRCEARRRIGDMVALARSDPAVRINADVLDADSWLLNVQNGTLDLKTGELRQHDRADLITKCCPVIYEPIACAPRFDAFLQEIMDGNEEMVEFLQRAVGHSLTGDTSERCLFLLWGTGRNGKSTFLHVMREMLGGYALHARAETILAKRGDSVPCDLARLKGARLATFTEVDEGRRMFVARVKEMTAGCDVITARFMRQNEFTFMPEFKPWIATNHKPTIHDDSDAIWDRLYTVPFTVRVPDDRIDKRLPEKLLGELPGILRWAVEGCLAWQEAGGLLPPDKVRAANAAYRTEMDTFAQWLDERCTIGLETLQARGGELWKDYKAWSEEMNVRAMSARRFGGRLTERFRKEVAGGGFRTYFGVGLRSEA